MAERVLIRASAGGVDGAGHATLVRLAVAGERAPVGRSSDVAKGDGGDLLPGEASSEYSRDVEDARRWFDTYDDLCRMKQKVLTELESQRDHVRPEGTAEINEDEGMLQAEYQRLRARREFWQSEIEARRSK